MKALLTVTPNPALDLTGHLPTLKVGSVNLMTSGHLHPAGKGLNVARVLRDLGAEVAVSGFLGAENQAPFHAICADSGLHDGFMVVPGATRINVKLVEESGEVTDLNFPGVQVSAADLATFSAHLQQQVADVDYVVMAGKPAAWCHSGRPADLAARSARRWQAGAVRQQRRGVVRRAGSRPVADQTE